MKRILISASTTLQSIAQILEQCLLSQPPIYHDLWEPQLPIEQACPELTKPKSMKIGGTSVDIYDVPDVGSIGHSFRKANNYSSGHAWERWHEPSGGRYFGCFYGDEGAGFERFHRLAESAYLTLQLINPELPDDDSYHGWMKVLHDLARNDPRPLLRSRSMVWRHWECESDEDREQWRSDAGSTPYPKHPVQRTLEHDVVTSSLAAISLILEETYVIPGKMNEDHFEPPLCSAPLAVHGDCPVCPETGKKPGGDSLADLPLSHVVSRGHPTWDSDRRELRVGTTIIKRFRQPAENQEHILTAFEELDWPPKIDDPLPFKRDIDPKRRFRETVDSLNKHHQVENIIKFTSDGTGQGILWTMLNKPQ